MYNQPRAKSLRRDTVHGLTDIFQCQVFVLRSDLGFVFFCNLFSFNRTCMFYHSLIKSILLTGFRY